MLIICALKVYVHARVIQSEPSVNSKVMRWKFRIEKALSLLFLLMGCSEGLSKCYIRIVNLLRRVSARRTGGRGCTGAREPATRINFDIRDSYRLCRLYFVLYHNNQLNNSLCLQPRVAKTTFRDAEQLKCEVTGNIISDLTYITCSYVYSYCVIVQ